MQSEESARFESEQGSEPTAGKAPFERSENGAFPATPPMTGGP